MKIYNEWMSDNEYFGEDYPNNKLLDDAKHRFELQKQSNEGRDAKVDGVLERIVAQNHTNPLNQSKYDKKLSFDIISDVHTGSLIEFDNKKWLVTSTIFNKHAYKVASVVECNNTLKLYNQNGILLEMPIVIESQTRLYSLGQDSNKYISTLNDEIIVYAPNNADTSEIKVDDIYKIGRRNYVVMTVQDVIIDGLLVLKMEVTTGEPVDERHLYSIGILNGEDITLYGGEVSTLQLTIECKLDGEIVTNPVVSYSSSDINCCTIDEFGLVTIVGTGSSIITASYGDASDTVNITSLMNTQDKFEIMITPIDTMMYVNQTKMFTANVFNNGVSMSYHGVKWSVTNVDNTNNVYCTYVVDDRNITITSKNNINKSIKIKATLMNDNTIFKEQIISFKSLV